MPQVLPRFRPGVRRFPPIEESQTRTSAGRQRIGPGCQQWPVIQGGEGLSVGEPDANRRRAPECANPRLRPRLRAISAGGGSPPPSAVGASPGSRGMRARSARASVMMPDAWGWVVGIHPAAWPSIASLTPRRTGYATCRASPVQATRYFSRALHSDRQQEKAYPWAVALSRLTAGSTGVASRGVWAP